MTLNEHYRSRFGCKVYKLSLDGGFTCPNRDGTLGTRGCIFCSAYGGGEFAEGYCTSVADQLAAAKARVSAKIKDGKYIAYFQSFTGTYGPVDRLETLYREATAPDDIVGLSIATRPDCLSEEVVIAPGETVMIPTGLAMEIPVGYGGFIYARSGLSVKKGLAPANKVGVIDADYRGEIMVALYNQSGEKRSVLHGERVAQLVIAPFLKVSFEESEELADTVRGAGGFGSTGK